APTKTSGRSPSSSIALITQMWATPLAAPPEPTKATRGRELNYTLILAAPPEPWYNNRAPSQRMIRAERLLRFRGARCATPRSTREPGAGAGGVRGCYIGPRMEHRRVGTTGLKVSAVSLGGWLTFGKSVGDEATRLILHTALDHGVDFIDLADV